MLCFTVAVEKRFISYGMDIVRTNQQYALLMMKIKHDSSFNIPKGKIKQNNNNNNKAEEFGVLCKIKISHSTVRRCVHVTNVPNEILCVKYVIQLLVQIST